MAEWHTPVVKIATASAAVFVLHPLPQTLVGPLEHRLAQVLQRTQHLSASETEQRLASLRSPLCWRGGVYRARRSSEYTTLLVETAPEELVLASSTREVSVSFDHLTIR